jgi:hypothetical protein
MSVSMAKRFPFFDKPDHMTVSGVHGGRQRRIYDERKVHLAPREGHAVVGISTLTLAQRSRHIALDRDSDKQLLLDRLWAEGLKTI